MQKTTGQLIPSDVAAFTNLTWDVALWDTSGMYNPASPDLLTVQVPGVYVIDAGVRWATSPLGTRFAGLCINGPALGGCSLDNNVAVSQYATNDDPGINTARLTQQTVSTQYKLNAGDTVQVIVVQNSGADLSVDQYAATSLNLAWVGNG